MKKYLILFIVVIFYSCNSLGQKKPVQKQISYPITKTDSAWKAELTDMEYYVLRKAGTERPFSSPLNKNHITGTYVCAACKTSLFKSDHKFDSGSGWPSFDREIEGHVAFTIDYDLGYARTEEHCATCGGHLGHVFDDGPRNTTGKRHCVNGVALKFIPEE
jgi:peptide-methionine (R)-S-oxide reductase